MFTLRFAVTHFLAWKSTFVRNYWNSIIGLKILKEIGSSGLWNPFFFFKLLNNNCGQECNYALYSEICHMKKQAIMKSTIFWARPNLDWSDLGKSNCGDPY